jgi:ZIP family zinc transporter
MKIIIFSAIAGIVGTGLGGLLSSVILSKKSSERMTCWMLSFAGGVMTSIVCFGLVPESLELTGILVCISGMVIGVVIIMALSRVLDNITEIKGDKLKIHETPEELYHESQIIHSTSPMLRSGLLMLMAIALHNIPEGLAIGAAGSHDLRLGAILALMIAVHNIPEGMAIASPLLTGGIKWWKVVLLTSLAGAPTLLGGVIGNLIGNISDFTVALSLSAAGGAMLYIVFCEIMPQSIVMTKDRKAALVTLFGIIIGMIVTKM